MLDWLTDFGIMNTYFSFPMYLYFCRFLACVHNVLDASFIEGFLSARINAKAKLFIII